MPGPGPGIHEFRARNRRDRGEESDPPRAPRLRVSLPPFNSWMPGPRPGMTSGVRMERGLCSECLKPNAYGAKPWHDDVGMAVAHSTDGGLLPPLTAAAARRSARR